MKFFKKKKKGPVWGEQKNYNILKLKKKSKLIQYQNYFLIII